MSDTPGPNWERAENELIAELDDPEAFNEQDGAGVTTFMHDASPYTDLIDAQAGDRNQESLAATSEPLLADEEEEGGEDEHTDDDMDDDGALDLQRIEEDAARARAAALEKLNELTTGHAFSTMRVLKKNGTTLMPTHAPLDPERFKLSASADMDAGPDLSFLLPGAAFLPTPKFAAPAEEARTSPKGSSSSRLPTPRFDTSQEVGSEAQLTSNEDQAPSSPSAPADASAVSNSEEDNVVDSMEKTKFMATWHYAEMTEDGGVALSFANLQGLDLAENAEDLEKMYSALGHMEEQQDLMEEHEATIMEQLTQEAAEQQDAFLGLSMDQLPGPAFQLPPSNLATVDECHDEVAEPRHSPGLGDTDGELEVPSPTTCISPTQEALSRKLENKVSGSGFADSVDNVLLASSQGDAMASPRPPVADAKRASTDGQVKKSFDGKAAAVPGMNASMRAGQLAGTPLNHEVMKTMKEDLARTIRAELMRSINRKVPGGEPGGPGAALRMGDAAGNQASANMASQHSPLNLSARSNVTTKEAMERSIRVAFVEGKIKPINIVMLVVGTRGDVQPFIGIALKLKEYGHRVRIASHKVYREFVTEFGLEFYPIGGDPKVLSEFVVKHRGIMPGLNIADALEQRDQVKQILYSSWGACVLPDPEHLDKPFIADAIVANPPAYGHSHCAEKLNVPLHVVFTMPWTPTKQFPNPFARIKTVIGGTNSKAREIMNWLSYFAVEDLAWLGMSGMVKDFRKKTLQLPDFEGKEHGSHALYHSKVPLTYIWSPSLVDRPSDWPHYCEVVGFVNVELQKLTKYTPPKELQDFLDAGDPPVYIGFGSLVVDDPVKLTRNFLDALKVTGLRAIIQKGWGGLGAGVKGDVEDVLFIGAAPHDWLFQKCCAVVHHGGAGTTSCGLYCGKPTFIVPFFGDQPFWGAACHKAGVGPAPVAIDDLSTSRIIDALKTLVMPNCQKAARVMQARMLQENGIDGAVDHLHRTIYGALLAGRTFTWMKRGTTRSQVSTTTVQEDSQEEGAVRGFFKWPWGGKSKGPSRTGSDSPALAAPSPPAKVTSASSSSAGAPPPSFSFHVKAASGASASTPMGSQVLRSVPPAGLRAASAVEVEMPKRKGFFSFLGC